MTIPNCWPNLPAPSPFAFFAAMKLQFFIVLFIYPETKDVSLEWFQHQFGLN
jgi:MFS transporter, SP family, arabinose:H+ symporter